MERAIQAVCSREDLTVARMPGDHAGGKWRLTYAAASGGSGHVELDINFLLRTPLWPTVELECRAVGSFHGTPTTVLDVHELAAGKLAALLARSASRDIFDSRALLSIPTLDAAKLRLAFVVYGGVNRRDWRTVSTGDVKVDVNEVQTALVPVLRSTVAPARGIVRAWTDRIFHNCKRETIGLPHTRSREWLLDIEFRQRETFAYACEAYSRLVELAARPAARRELLDELLEQHVPSDPRLDRDRYAEVLREAVGARNGWKRILSGCSPSRPADSNFRQR